MHGRLGQRAAGRQGGRVSIEGCASCRLSIKDLGPLLRAPLGRAAWMHYRQNDEHLMTVVIEARPEHDYLRLQHPSRALEQAEPMDYMVGLTSTAAGFGGRRQWFICPLSGRRCAVLYLPRGGRRFGSAKGYGLAYAVTRMEEQDRLWRRMAKIAGRLGDASDPQMPPDKPKGMRAATYDRLLDAWHEAVERRDAIYDARIAAFVARLGGRLGG
jgi:hypothetical protein